MKVYVVTDGCYSDYSIEGVFDDLEKAEIFCATLDSKDASIEEYDTESINIKSSEEPKRVWKAIVYDTGKTSFANVYLTFKNRNSIERWDGGVRTYWIVTVTLPKDTPEEKVKKIMYDRVAEYKAKQTGVV